MVRSKEPLTEADAQLDALLEELAEARRRIAALEAADAERESVARALRERTHELGGRIKELNCLYSIAHLVERPSISLEEIFEGTLGLVSPAWQYPRIFRIRTFFC